MNSSQYFVSIPRMGQAAASPSGQMVLPAMPLATVASCSTSALVPSPASILADRRLSQLQPMRQAVKACSRMRLF